MSVAKEQSPVNVGDVLAGKYRVDRVLGVGGMGVVVAATHLQLHQTVALKFILKSAVEADAAVARFLREARAAARLKSEHVAKVLDVGTLENGAPYMVMEFLEGADLAQVLAQAGPLDPQTAADYVLQACEAIAEAHGYGIIHRDLKPQNLFLTYGVGGSPLVKVLDFGISKTVEGVESALTRTSTLMGSPLYMSPEQMRSARDVDVRTDVWALGVILFELLSGQAPFHAETLPELCLKVVQDPPRSLAELRANVPPELVAVVSRCLEKNPAARYANAAELAEALAPFASPSGGRMAERARLALARTSEALALGWSPSRPSIDVLPSHAPSSPSSPSVRAVAGESGSASGTGRPGVPAAPSSAAGLSTSQAVTRSSSRSRVAPIAVVGVVVLIGAGGVLGASRIRQEDPGRAAAAPPNAPPNAPPSADDGKSPAAEALRPAEQAVAEAPSEASPQPPVSTEDGTPRPGADPNPPSRARIEATSARGGPSRAPAPAREPPSAPPPRKENGKASAPDDDIPSMRR